jgi:transposase
MRLVMQSRRWRSAKPLLLMESSHNRKAWLFCGSDDHAKSTAALYSVVASARLHGHDPEDPLRCLIRLVPLWPDDRMLELAPLFWARTRARLDAKQLAADFGYISIPSEPLDTSLAIEATFAIAVQRNGWSLTPSRRSH